MMKSLTKDYILYDSIYTLSRISIVIENRSLTVAVWEEGPSEMKKWLMRAL